jgi:hypothetical protein
VSDIPLKPYLLPGHIVLREPKLRFGSKNPRDLDIHPIRGLLRFGRYSKDKLAAVSDPIRVGIIAPAGHKGRVLGLLTELEQSHLPRERKAYLLSFPGFEKVFGVRLARAAGGSVIELPAELSDEVANSPQPHVALAAAMTRALAALGNMRHDFDVILILLSKQWERGFRNRDEDFDLHDFIKAHAASDGICVQILRETSALDYFCRCSVAWRLSIALYTKAGGIPWVLAAVEPGTAFIGIDYALRSGTRPESRFVICCSQVFDAEGSGLEFVAYEADGVQQMFGRNPFLRRDQMLKVMARSLSIYQRKHAGDPPRRVVVHKNTEFRSQEIDGVFDAFPNAENIELVHVQQECGWRGVLIAEPQKTHGYPCPRGTTLTLGPHEALLWTQGNLPEVADGKNFYKEGKGIPEPLLLTRYAGLSPLDELCRETLALTKMDWNNDGPYDRLPVTLNFASTLATIVRRMPKLEPRSYPVRLFM